MNSIVQATIPDQGAEPRLFSIVTTCMMHRSCGADNSRSPCMVDGKYSKRFPKEFRDETSADFDSYPMYRRPNDGRTCVSAGKILDNRSVVPYNTYLALRYNGHLNVEICGMIQAVKYMYKYVYKGPDRATLHMIWNENGFDSRVVDEIDEFVNARYVHLSGYQNVTFQGGREEDSVRQAADKETMLTAFSKLNEEHEPLYGEGDVPELEKDVRTLLYVQVPEFFSFDQQARKWKMRQRKSRPIGRMYTADPLDVERYSLRTLLLDRRGPKSFSDLGTVDGVVHVFFKEAAKALGLMNDDSHYESCLSEASEFHMPGQFRSLFSSLLCFCSVSEPEQLWEKFKRALAEDYIHRGLGEEEGVVRAYYDIMDKMIVCGANLMSIISPSSHEMSDQLNEEEFTEDEHISCGSHLMVQLNVHQKAAADSISSTIDDGNHQHFFIDGPGGSGKTLLYTALYHTLLGMRKNVICVAWTEIAANLLPNGRTASSAFKLNIHDNNRTCTMKRQLAEANILRNVSVIF
ncbi:unnamed protein product [Haemonchus placei]|uniref:ATP-dependent DNA helicase n=1 Tax=Haemonchus placei TaxID=6290 RepID=A0A0N4WN53_HAEPC|nr:unnamed protein product [Haemonchus placei]